MCQTARPHFARKTLALVSLFAAFAGAGCGRSSDTSSGATTPSSDKAAANAQPTGDFKIGLVMSGPTSDNGWNGGAFTAWKGLRKDLSLSDDNSPFVENQTSPDKQEKSVVGFAKEGCKIVFAHGYEFDAIAKKIAGDYPKTVFVVSSGSTPGPNIQPIKLQFEDGAYLEGMLAAGMSKTGKLAFVGAENSPELVRVYKAFVAGAKAVKPAIEILPQASTGSWDDADKAKSATLPLINQGADVIMQDVDAAAQGVFNAVQEANRGGKAVYALGTNSDQNAVAPDVVLASVPIFIGKAFLPIINSVKAGTFTPVTTPYDMKSGVIDFVLNPQLEPKIPADLKQKIADVQKQIMAGTFQAPKG